MKGASILALLPLMASTVHGGLVGDLSSYGSEAVSEVEEVASTAMESVNDVAEAFQEIAADQHHRKLNWQIWCPGNNWPDHWCQQRMGIYALAKWDRWCYNNDDDCKCQWGYVKMNGQCVGQSCAADPMWFCMEQLGQYAKPAHWGCVQTVHDCMCNHGYTEVDGECRQCAQDPSWFCKEELGEFAIPRPGRGCYHVPSDCKCMDGYAKYDGQCVYNPCPHGQGYVHGECHDEPDGCAYDPLWYCMDICGPHGIPRKDCVKSVLDCMCEHGTSPFDGTCVPPAGGFGDPHFTTFHGHEFQFHGECDLVLVQAPAIDLDIHVRTTIRYDYSFISQAAIKLGDYIFEVGSWGEYQLDGISTPDLPLVIGKYHISVEILNDIKKKYRFTIRHADVGRSIDVVSLKDYVAVKLVNATESDFFNAKGLMGHYAKADMVARDGVTKMDDSPDAYGNEWQVRPEEDGQLFSDAREPQYPNSQCRMPSPNAINARDRKLGESKVSREDAEAACLHVSQHKNNCIEDVLRSRDIEMALVY